MVFPITPLAAVVMKERITTIGGDVVAEFVLSYDKLTVNEPFWYSHASLA
jgi:hypothetical protein